MLASNKLLFLKTTSLLLFRFNCVWDTVLNPTAHATNRYVGFHSFQIIRFTWRPLSRISYVLIVPPKPRPRFVPPMRRPVEPLVHSPKRVKAARVGGVGMVDDAVGECERAHARRLASVGGEVGAGHGRELACEPPPSRVSWHILRTRYRVLHC
jgi:hypothetical protein